MFLCLHFHNYVGISQLALQGRLVLTLSLVHPAHGALSALTSLARAFCWVLWDSGGQDRPGCLLPTAHALLPLTSWMGPVLVPGWHHRLSVDGAKASLVAGLRHLSVPGCLTEHLHVGQPSIQPLKGIID